MDRVNHYFVVVFCVLSKSNVLRGENNEYRYVQTYTHTQMCGKTSGIHIPTQNRKFRILLLKIVKFIVYICMYIYKRDIFHWIKITHNESYVLFIFFVHTHTHRICSKFCRHMRLCQC